ncbi:transposase, partial [Bifidobacterium catulorum]|uniref:transposase n=1 Tax=Bifidobacterium catulorum TaxID=1630173 RepID=UPI003F6AD403
MRRAWPAVRPAGRAALAPPRPRVRAPAVGVRAAARHVPRARGVTVAMVPWARRKSAYTRDFEQQVAWLGVDETSYRKGHKYMTVVVDHDRGRVVWMHQGHG